MSRQLVTALLLSFSVAGCAREGTPSEPQKLDRRISEPVRVPTLEEWRRVPNFRIGGDSVEVVTLSIPSGRRVSNAVDLRRLLVSLPRTDWPYGRQAVCFFPSIIGIGADQTLVEVNSRWLFDVLRELKVSCPASA